MYHSCADSSIILGLHDPILSQLSIQGAPRDSRFLRDLVFISPDLLRDLQDRVFLGILQSSDVRLYNSLKPLEKNCLDISNLCH